LGEAQTIVKAFCHARSIPYYETGLLQPYRELLQHLHQVSVPLREERYVGGPVQALRRQPRGAGGVGSSGVMDEERRTVNLGL
jgi:hypothetical protein